MSIRNDLLEKILLAVETGTAFPVIVKNVQQPYLQLSPALNTEIDTQINPADYNGNSDIVFAISVVLNASGNTYALFESVDSNILFQNPMVRVARSSEFEGVGGDANFAFWYDDATQSIHYECDLDGGGKTIGSASITAIRLDIQAA